MHPIEVIGVDLTSVLDKLLLPLALLAGQLWLHAKFKSAEEKRDAARADTDAKRAAEAAWRDDLDRRMAEFEQRLSAQDGPTATANHAVGSYLTMGGTLYRVTTAIATGEAITPGTNVMATTVMAEVLSLIQ